MSEAELVGIMSAVMYAIDLNGSSPQDACPQRAVEEALEIMDCVRAYLGNTQFVPLQNSQN